MTRKICEVGLIINVIHLDLVCFTPLEVVLHVEAFDPAWAQVVHDDFSHADTLPLSARLSIENEHTICPRECIQIRQILASKTQTYGLDEAAGGRVDRLVNSGEDGFIQVTADTGSRCSLHAALVLVGAHASAAIAH